METEFFKNFPIGNHNAQLLSFRNSKLKVVTKFVLINEFPFPNSEFKRILKQSGPFFFVYKCVDAVFLARQSFNQICI